MTAVTFLGIEPTAELAAWVGETRPPVLRLLRRNIDTPDQVRHLTGTLRREAGYPVRFAVRHEGGAETPFTRGVTFFPGLAALEKSKNPDLVREIGRVMRRELSQMGIDENLIERSTPTAEELARGFEEGPSGEPEEAEALSAQAAALALRLKGTIPLPPEAVLLPRFGDAADRYTIDDELRDAAARLRPRVPVLEAALRPDPGLEAMAVEWAAGYPVVAVFLFEPSRYPGQQRLVERLRKRSPSLVLVDLSESGPGFEGVEPRIRTRGFRFCQLSAAVDRLLAQRK